MPKRKGILAAREEAMRAAGQFCVDNAHLLTHVYSSDAIDLVFDAKLRFEHSDSLLYVATVIATAVDLKGQETAQPEAPLATETVQ